MKLKYASALLCAAFLTVVADSGPAAAQIDCRAAPPGPARTDCYIWLSRFHRQQAEIAAGLARQQSNRAIYRQVTGKRPKYQRPRLLAQPSW